MLLDATFFIQAIKEEGKGRKRDSRGGLSGSWYTSLGNLCRKKGLMKWERKGGTRGLGGESHDRKFWSPPVIGDRCGGAVLKEDESQREVRIEWHDGGWGGSNRVSNGKKC